MVTFGKSPIDSLFGQQMSEQCIGGAVELWSGNDIVSQLSNIHYRIVNGCHPRTYTQRIDAALKCGYTLFQHCVSGVSNASVDVPLDIEIEQRCPMLGAIKLECDGLIYGDCHRLRSRVAVIPSVNRDSL